jgi:hypothetical protein
VNYLLNASAFIETSISMPNIGESFGISFNETSDQPENASMSNNPAPQKGNVSPSQPSTSTNFVNQPADDGDKAGTSKESQEDATRPSIGLYEELLATTTGRCFWIGGREIVVT